MANNRIHIVMGGYLNENHQLMNRAELDKAIMDIQDELDNLRNDNKKLTRCIADILGVLSRSTYNRTLLIIDKIIKDTFKKE